MAVVNDPADFSCGGTMMGARELHMPAHHQAVVARFVAACQADERVLAAFLGGSYAAGTADARSDLDLYVITSDNTYESFLAERRAFIEQLGEPYFLEVFPGHGAAFIFFVLSDGTEGELGLGRESHITQLHGGPHCVLLEKRGILAGVAFPPHTVEQSLQVETLRRLISWFWHDLRHHVLTPLARGQLWSAYGGLEDLRRTCVDLARLSENFSAKAEGYEKVEQAVPAERLASLQATVSPLEREAMLRAARALVQVYEVLAPPLAQAHGIPYPADLARMLSDQLAHER
jgi:lincosamide nucleotidyltransferase